MRRGLLRLYLALAAIGAIFPWILFLPWVAEHRFAPELFVAQLFATPPAAIFSSDVLYAAAIFILFVFVEGRRLGMRHLWLPPLAVLVSGLCFALPLFLAMRERAAMRTGSA
jgi:hypothetical protein